MHMPPTMPMNTLEPKVALSRAGADSAVYMRRVLQNATEQWLLRHSHCTGDKLAAHAEALQRPADDEQEGSPCADGVVLGSEGDGEAGHGHQQHGPHQRRFAPARVGKPAEEDAAEGAEGG